MKLVPAGGSPRMQKALTHRYVHTIVAIVIQQRHVLRQVANVLRTYEHHTPSGFTDTLELLRLRFSRSQTGEQVITPPHIIDLIQTLYLFYQQSDEDIRYQRGAILELLTYELVRPRYKPGECVSNHRFVDGKYASDQLDVAALSNDRRHIEGYECKLKVDGVESADCTNLAYLADVAEQRGYDAHVGIVSLDESQQMRRKLKRLQPAASIALYGLDNLAMLEVSPF